MPKGYGLGEIVYSLSLLPNEEVTLEFKTWETAKTQTETGEDIESRNLSDVSAERSDVSEVLHDINTKENFHIDASAEASWGWGSASVKTGYAREAQEQHKTVNTRMRKSAEQSVNEMKRRQSVKMTVSRESGKEEKTSRTIKNINQTRTLNVNYYQVMRQYEVSLNLYEVDLVVLGKIFAPSAQGGDGATGYTYPTISEMAQSLSEYSLDPEHPIRFQNTVLRCTTPLPDVSTEPDLFGRFRYAFRVHPGREEDFLHYLFGFASGTIGNPKKLKVFKEGSPVAIPTIGAIKIEVPNFLFDVRPSEYVVVIDGTVLNVLSELTATRALIGPVEDGVWNTSLPTNGIYAEVMLGLCSGGEDYIEINRQFDLELKQLEIERLKLELEKMRLVNERISTDHRRELVITNPTENSRVNLNVFFDPSSEYIENVKTEIKFENQES